MNKNRLYLVYFLGVALLLTFVILFPLIHGGMEVTPDSVKYLNSAENLIKGFGISIGVAPEVSPNIHWAPGYSMVLSIPLFFWFNWLLAAQVIATASFIALLFLTAVLLFRTTGSLSIALLSEVLLGTHPVILLWSGSILSELLSWVFVVLSIVATSYLILSPSKRWAILSGLAVAAAVLVRFILFGIFMGYLISVWVLLSSRFSLRKVLKFILLGYSCAIVLIGSWLLRNWVLSGALGSTGGGDGRLLRNSFYVIANQWYIWLGRTWPDLPFTLLILAPLVLLFFWAKIKRSEFIHAASSQEVILPVVFLVSFFYFVIYCITVALFRTYLDPVTLDSRMFSPLAVILIIMLSLMAVRKHNANYSWRKGIAFQSVVYLLFSCAIIFQGIRALGYLPRRDLWYSSMSWRNSATLNFAVSHFNQDEILTTDPEAFWLWFGIYPSTLPKKISNPISVLSILKNKKALVWFNRTHRKYLIQPKDFKNEFFSKKITLADGIILTRE